MCEILKQLIEIGTFDNLQEKLKDWYDNFKVNSCDQNVAIGCEIIELNAKMQGQLFKLLSLCASEGGTYGGDRVIKSKLLPILCQGFFTSEAEFSNPTDVLKQPSMVNQKLNDSNDVYHRQKYNFENDDTYIMPENKSLEHKLAETKIEEDRVNVKSSNDKTFEKEEIDTVREKLNNYRNENERLTSQELLTSRYEMEIKNLKENIDMLLSQPRLGGGFSPSINHNPDFKYNSSYLRMSHWDPYCRTKEQDLVSKMNDLFSLFRGEAMNTLLNYSDDRYNNQKILFHSVMESFNASKSAFRLYKSKIRNDVIGHHSGFSLEDSVQHYINNYADLEINLSSLFHEVIRALNAKVPLIQKPKRMSFEILGSFIEEACKISWSMLSLPIPIDVYHPTSDGELFDETRYRRSYDSEFTADFVLHHIWPCLIKNGIVVAKGEAVTKRVGYYLAKHYRSDQGFSKSMKRVGERSFPSPIEDNYLSKSLNATRRS